MDPSISQENYVETAFKIKEILEKISSNIFRNYEKISRAYGKNSF